MSGFKLFRWCLNQQIGSLIFVVSLLFVLLVTAGPVFLSAQTQSDTVLFGVNLVGTFPLKNAEGKTITSGQLKTPDSRLALNIPAGTFIRNAAGLPQAFISATQITEPPPIPSQQKLISSYALGTPGATFNPTVGMVFSYKDSDLPPKVAEINLSIASWNGTEWVKLTSDIDTVANTVSTSIASFTTYALLVNIQAQATTNVPTTIAPATTQTVPTSSTTAVPTIKPINPANNSFSPFLLVTGVVAVVLVLVLILAARKK
jgi:hypothetical protein